MPPKETVSVNLPEWTKNPLLYILVLVLGPEGLEAVNLSLDTHAVDGLSTLLQGGGLGIAVREIMKGKA